MKEPSYSGLGLTWGIVQKTVVSMLESSLPLVEFRRPCLELLGGQDRASVSLPLTLWSHCVYQVDRGGFDILGEGQSLE